VKTKLEPDLIFGTGFGMGGGRTQPETGFQIPFYVWN